MAILIGSIVLFFAIAFAVFGYLNYLKRTKNRFNKNWYLLFLTCGLAFVVLLFGSFTKVGANEVGIIYDDRYGVLDKTYSEGFRVKSIFEHITPISTANRTAQVVTSGQTNDGQYANFEISIIYRIDTENAGKFYKKTSDTDLNEKQLNTLVKQTLQSNTIKYDIFGLLSDSLEVARCEFEQALTDIVFKNYYVTVVSVSFDDVDSGENIENILQQKAEAEQKIEIARKEAEANLIKAENEVKMAEQEALVKQTLADAEAYAVKIQGEASADAATAYVDKINGMIKNIETATGLSYQESTDLVLSIIFYDTWDGKLPEVLTSDSLSSMIGGLLQTNNNSGNTGE